MIQAFDPWNLLSLAFGAWYGLVIGALPGLGATVACALLIPTTYNMQPVTAILMLMSVFLGGMYGGSISAILLGVPGTPAAVVTVLDGNAMAKAGYPGRALGYSLYASVFGGLVGGLVLVTAINLLAELTIKLADPELFLLGVLGLLSVASLGSKNVPMTLISLLLGLFVGTIGLDLFTSSYRYTFGNIYLSDGVHIVALLCGLYALTDVLEMTIGDLSIRYVTDVRNLRCHIPLKEFLEVKWTVLKSSLIGVVFGVVPGLGASPATWFAYTQAKRDSTDPDSFGKGSPHGIVAAEAANSAVVGGALIPTLALGIPGSSTAAVICSAMIIHGIQPGPNLLSSSANLMYAIYVGIFIAVFFLFILGKFTNSLLARMLTCPAYILIPLIIVAIMIGSYSARYFFLDIWIAVLSGLLMFFLKRIDFDLPAFTLAFVLAALVETRFRRSLMLSIGSPTIFFTRFYCLIIWALIALMIATSVRAAKRNKARRAAAGQN